MSDKQPGKVKAAILNWLGVPVQLTDSAFWSQWLSSRSAAGQQINEDSVMSISAAWACARLISETVGTLPLNLYERTSEGRKLASNHPLYSILHKNPNSKSTAVTYWESNVVAMLLRGNGFSRKQMISNRLVGLKFMPPHKLQFREREDGTLQLSYLQDNKKWIDIPDNEVFHIPGFSVDGQYGVSTIKYGAQVFGSAIAAQEAANGVFERGLMPTVAFKMDRVLKKEQRVEFREALSDISGALNSGKSPLLEGGMEAQMIGINPSDAQLIESRGYSVEEVCRWFRVDPSLVGHGNKDSNWGTGLEQKLIAFLTFTLRPWLTRIEQSINKYLLTPIEQQRYYAEFSIDGLLRADSSARAAFYSVMVNNGILTRDEVRELENMPKRGGNADVLTVQTAMAPIDTLGQSTNAEAARNALAAWLNEQDDKVDKL